MSRIYIAEELLARYASGERDFQDVDLIPFWILDFVRQFESWRLPSSRNCRTRRGFWIFQSFLRLNSVNSSVVFFFQIGIRSADLSYTDLRFADFRRANFNSANLQYAELRHVNLGNVDLSNADLRFSKLRKADLHNTQLDRADIDGADFSFAKNLTVEQIKSAKNWEKAKYDRDLCLLLGLPPQDESLNTDAWR